VNLADNY